MQRLKKTQCMQHFKCHMVSRRFSTSLTALPSLFSKRGKEAGGFVNKQTQADLAAHFYDDKIIPLSRKSKTTMSIRTMSEFWFSQEELVDKLTNSGNHMLQELPVRLSHRIIDIHNLPFVLACNPHLQEVNGIYLNSLETLLNEKPLESFEDTVRFSMTLRTLFETHNRVVPSLARALKESRLHSTPEHVQILKSFMDVMLKKRISTRMIAGQYLQCMDLHPLQPQEPNSLSGQAVVGLVERYCRPADVVLACAKSAQEMCRSCYGVSPEIELEGQLDISFAYVRVHLEYIVFEVLKNSLRATVENQQRQIREGRIGEGEAMPTVVVVVSSSEGEVSVKVSDRGGGISSHNLKSTWEYGFTTSQDEILVEGGDDSDSGSGPKGDENVMHGFGFGLPLSRLYARFFGGDLEINSSVGYGTDVYLKINRLGRHMEHIHV